MAEQPPRIDALKIYTDWLRLTVERYARLARDLIGQGSEKGRIIESVVSAALREMLPDRFSLGTGFIFNRKGETSRQIDLIVYDRHFNAPIVLHGGAGLFPIECVFAIIEVKSSVTALHLDEACLSISEVRRIARQKQYIAYGVKEVAPDKFDVAPVTRDARLAPRSYIIATDSVASSAETFRQHLLRATTKHQAMVHGALVLGRGWFAEQLTHTDAPAVRVHVKHAFDRFLVELRDGVQSLAVTPLNMRAYLSALLDEGNRDGMPSDGTSRVELPATRQRSGRR